MSTALPLHEVQRLIKQLDNPIRSAKNRSVKQLVSVSVYPSLISSVGDFVQEVFLPILNHVSNDSECVRENCVVIINKYVSELGEENLKEIFGCTLCKLTERLRSEETEPSEQVRLSILKLILNILNIIPENSEEIKIDDFCEGLISSISLALKSADME